MVGKSDFNENPVVSLDLDLDFGLRLRVCQNRQPQVTDYMDEDGYNGYTAYLFIGYYFLHWIHLDNRLQPSNSAPFNYC